MIQQSEIINLNREQYCLHVIDPQEKLMAHIHGAEQILSTIEIMVACAQILNVGTVANTQYKKGLGGYPEQLAQLLSGVKKIDKTEFNCLASEETSLYYDMALQGVKVTVLVGVESHICVYQTACGLLQRNILPWIVSDGVSSRDEGNHLAALKQLQAMGCIVGPAEMILYQLMKQAGTSEFKKVLPYITKRN